MAMKKRTTNINESARSVLGITRDEYALCQYYHYRAGDPRGKKDGWCGDQKDEVAEFIGITRPGLYKMIARLTGKGLLETDQETGFVRATGKWIDTESERKQSLHGDVNKVYTERKQSLHGDVNKVYTERKQSLHGDVNKVYTERKQSLHGDVNKVYTHNKVEKEIELEERESSVSAPAPAPENQNLKAEKETPPPSPAPPPPPPKTDTALTYDQYPNPRTADELQERLRAYFTANPNEWHVGVIERARAGKWPLEKTQDAVLRFCLHKEKTGDMRRTFGQYRADLTTWFLNQPRFDEAGKGVGGKQHQQDTSQPYYKRLQ